MTPHAFAQLAAHVAALKRQETIDFFLLVALCIFVTYILDKAKMDKRE